MVLKAEIVIPTWNSMPELGEVIKSIPSAFKGNKTDIYVVDKKSSDGTKEYAEEHGCHVITDTHSLGSARLAGAKQTSNEFIYFVDSDILLPENWAYDMKKHVSKHFSIGMAFGVTVELHPKLSKMQLWKMPKEPRELKLGERAWTNNTYIHRDLVLSSDIKDVNAWEDWIIAQNVMNQGYRVFQFPICCIHNHKTQTRWGFNRAGWNAKGMIDVVGLNLYTLKYINYYILQGLFATVKFKDLFYTKWGVVSWMEVVRGVLNLKSFSRK